LLHIHRLLQHQGILRVSLKLAAFVTNLVLYVLDVKND